MRVYFKEEKHQYFNEEGDGYISVSALAKRLERPKDWNAIKKKYAKKHGLSVKEVTKEWDNKKKLGVQAGTLIHKDEEEALLNSAGIIKPCLFEEGVKWSIPIERLDDNTIYPELMIYDHIYKICGQSDKVITSYGTLQIEDYKTDKSIERKAFSSEWTKAEKLLPPVDYLDNCNFNMYSIKMSMYMYMLWNANKHFKIGPITLKHIEIERDENLIPIFIDGKPIIKQTTLIEVPYRKEAVRNIFEYYKNGKL